MLIYFQKEYISKKIVSTNDQTQKFPAITEGDGFLLFFLLGFPAFMFLSLMPSDVPIWPPALFISH